ANPVGPTRHAESSTSMPPPELRSSTRSPSCSSATAVGLPQPKLASTASNGSPAAVASSYRPAPKLRLVGAQHESSAATYDPSVAEVLEQHEETGVSSTRRSALRVPVVTAVAAWA